MFHNCKSLDCKLQIRMERLYGYSDTSYMIGVFPIALLTAEFGQVWAEHV